MNPADASVAAIRDEEDGMSPADAIDAAVAAVAADVAGNMGEFEPKVSSRIDSSES